MPVVTDCDLGLSKSKLCQSSHIKPTESLNKCQVECGSDIDHSVNIGAYDKANINISDRVVSEDEGFDSEYESILFDQQLLDCSEHVHTEDNDTSMKSNANLKMNNKIVIDVDLNVSGNNKTVDAKHEIVSNCQLNVFNDDQINSLYVGTPMPNDIKPPTVQWPPTTELDLDEMVQLYNVVKASESPNYLGCKIIVGHNFNQELWYSLLNDYDDKQVIEFLLYGFPIGYNKDYRPKSALVNHKGAYSFPEHVDNYISKELSFGAMIGPFECNPFDCQPFIAPLNTVPKKDSINRRVIMDMSFPLEFSVNAGIPNDTYLGIEFSLTYPSIDDLIHIIWDKGPGCLLFKRDLSRAYRQIYVDPADYPLLGLSWRNCLFFDRVLPFGMRSAAMICQRTTNAIAYMFGNMGYSVINYLDDFGGGEVPHKAEEAFQTLGRLLHQLGVEESPDKACSPSSSMVFLGILIDTVTMTAHIPEEKMLEIQNLLSIWAHKTTTSKRQIQSIIGKLQFASRCVRPGRIFISRMLATLRQFPKDKTTIKVPIEFKKDINWWARFFPLYNGISIIPRLQWSSPDAIVATDACLSGCGGICGLQYFHCVFPDFVVELQLHINALEILTVAVACKLWGREWKGKRIKIFCDNLSSVTVLNSGRSKDPFLLECMREVAFVAAQCQFEIKAVHLPGVENRVPDLLSRWYIDHKSRTKFFDIVHNGIEVKVHHDLFRFTHKW